MDLGEARRRAIAVSVRSSLHASTIRHRNANANILISEILSGTA